MSHLRHIGPMPIEQLLTYPHTDGLTIAERWELIGQIDEQIDHLISLRSVMRQNKLPFQNITENITQLLEKKRAIWLTIQPHACEIIRACNLPALA